MTCSTAQEGFEAVETLKPDVLVLDLKLAGDDGLSLLRRLDSTKPPAVVVLTASHDEDDLLAAARLGARGIVLKAMAPRVLEDCLRTVSAGGQSLNVDGVDLANRLTQRQNVEDELEQVLTPRELGDPAARGGAAGQPGDRHAALDQRRHGEDPPASRLREAAAAGPARSADLPPRPPLLSRLRAGCSQCIRRRSRPVGTCVAAHGDLPCGGVDEERRGSRPSC